MTRDAVQRGGNVCLGPHADLWGQVVDHLRRRTAMHVKVFNFKAHVEMCNAATDEDKLHAWGNNVVDQSAKKAITSDNYTLMKRMERIAREREYVFFHDECKLRHGMCNQ